MIMQGGGSRRNRAKHEISQRAIKGDELNKVVTPFSKTFLCQ